MTTYEEVAAHYSLDRETTRRFVRYMRSRSWRGAETTHCKTGYAAEWARRFVDGIEYQASDLEGLALLDAMHDEDGRREEAPLHDDIAAAKAHEDAQDD